WPRRQPTPYRRAPNPDQATSDTVRRSPRHRPEPPHHPLETGPLPELPGPGQISAPGDIQILTRAPMVLGRAGELANPPGADVPTAGRRAGRLVVAHAKPRQGPGRGIESESEIV